MRRKSSWRNLTVARTKSSTKSISKSEVLRETWNNLDGSLRYVISSNKEMTTFYIYDNDYNKLGSGRNPIALADKYFGKE